MDEPVEEIELEILSLDDEAPAARVPRRAWFRRWWRELSIAAVIVALLCGAYAAVAVIGIRRLEAQWLAAAELREELDDYVDDQRREQRIGALRVLPVGDAQTRADDATREYRRRVAALRKQAAGVVAVDPGVRRLRQRVVRGLTPTPSEDARVVDTEIDAQLARLRLKPGNLAPPPPLRLSAARDPFAAVRTGDRLVVELEDDLVELDVDAGTGRVIDGSDVFGMAAVGRHVVYLDDDEAKVVVVGSTGRARALGRADEVHSRNDGRNVLLVSTEQDEDGEEVFDGNKTVVSVDVESGARGPELTVQGEVTMAWGRHLVVMRYRGRQSTAEVWDLDQRAVARRFAGTAVDLRGDILVWQAPRVVHVANLGSGEDLTLPVPEDTFLGAGVISPDGSRLAVVWRRVGRVSDRLGWLSLIALDQERPAVDQDLGGDRLPSLAAWSPDGRRLYLVLDDYDEERSGISVYDVAARRLERLRVEGVVYGLAAF